MRDSAPNPLDWLPHGEPFRFLTRVVSLVEQKEAVAEWNLTGDEDFFRGHFPGEPIVPGVLLTEAAAQLCGVITCFSKEQRGAAAGIGNMRLVQSNMKFPAAARPPAVIVLHGWFVRSVGSLTMMKVRVESDSAVVAEGSIALVDMSGLERGD